MDPTSQDLGKETYTSCILGSWVPTQWESTGRTWHSSLPYFNLGEFSDSHCFRASGAQGSVKPEGPAALVPSVTSTWLVNNFKITSQLKIFSANLPISLLFLRLFIILKIIPKYCVHPYNPISRFAVWFRWNWLYYNITCSHVFMIVQDWRKNIRSNVATSHSFFIGNLW